MMKERESDGEGGVRDGTADVFLQAENGVRVSKTSRGAETHPAAAQIHKDTQSDTQSDTHSLTRKTKTADFIAVTTVNQTGGNA